MKTPVALLGLSAAIALIVSLATGHAARNQSPFTSDGAERAVTLAAASNLALIMTGACIVGLLVVWAVMAGVRELGDRPVTVKGNFPDGTVWNVES